MPSIGSTNPSKPDKLGPFQKVTPTNRAGDSNAEDAPQIVAQTIVRQNIDARRADVQVQILLALRAISRQLTEGFGLADEPEAMLNDEELILGTDSSS